VSFAFVDSGALVGVNIARVFTLKMRGCRVACEIPSAPKARNATAWANGPGVRRKIYRALKARHISARICRSWN